MGFLRPLNRWYDDGYGRSAFAGGVADSGGTDSEAGWTIWRGVLPVLRGGRIALQVERPDLAGEAAESGSTAGRRTAQMRCTSASGSMPPRGPSMRLRLKGWCGRVGTHLASGTRVVFTSSTPWSLDPRREGSMAIVLAKSSANLDQIERSARDNLVQIWSLDIHGVHDRLIAG